MSACISRHGEYSEHTWDENHWCSLCGVHDDEWQAAEVKRLRVQLGCVKALATLWEESAVQMDAESKGHEPGWTVTQKQRRLRVSAAISRSHAAALREMLGDD